MADPHPAVATAMAGKLAGNPLTSGQVAVINS